MLNFLRLEHCTLSSNSLSATTSKLKASEPDTWGAVRRLFPSRDRRNPFIKPQWWLLLALFSTWAFSSFAQNTTVGIQPFGSYQGNIDQINLQDLGVHIDIPLYVHKSRGANTGISVHLIYDTSYFAPIPLASNPTGADVGWRVVAATESGGGTISGSLIHAYSCPAQVGITDTGTYSIYGNYKFTDATGYQHSFSGMLINNNCNTTNGPPTTSLNEPATDGSGFVLASTGASSTVTAPSGIVYSGAGSLDTNGNSGYLSGPPDTIGTQPVTITDTSNVSVTISGGGYYVDSNGNATSRAPTTIQYTDTTGQSRSIVVNYTMYNPPRYNFVGYGMVSSVSFPDGSSYNFTYQQPVTYMSTQGTQLFALLQSVQLPTGGLISYANSYPSASTSDLPCNVPAQLVRTTSDGVTTYNKVSTQSNCSSTTTISKADGTSEQISFVTGAMGYLETSHYWYNASGATLQSASRCYNSNCSGTNVGSVSSIATTTTIASGLSSQTTQLFNNFLPTELDEYDFGASTLTRKTVTQYASLGNNISNRPQSVTLYNSSGSVIKQTTYGYDEYTLTGLSLVATSGLPQHSSVTGARGNQTSIHQWLSTTNGTLDTHYQYDDAGQIVATEDARTNWIHYTYDPTTDSCLWSTTLPPPSSSATVATSAKCDSNSGLITSVTDANGVTTQYSYDAMLRPSGQTVTAGSATVAQTTVAYNISSSPATVTTTTVASPSPSQQSSVTLDGYGRTSLATAATGASVTSAYDLMGRVHTVTNPCFSAGGCGTTTYAYDALGRTTSETFPDNTVVTWCYDGIGTSNHSTCPGNATSLPAGHVVNVYDENGYQWQQVSDGLGRLRAVMEPSPTTGVASLETDYGYDLLNNLISVNQKGTSSETPRPRTFLYDSLSRLLTSTNPETGTICYGSWSGSSVGSGTCQGGYDGNGNLLAKVDARGTSTSYVYDALNRLTSKNYSD